ncbi:MAG: lipoic acid synthetase [Planctomycetota bacterium]|jgi:lipoic acid synthetase
MSSIHNQRITPGKKPDWLKVPIPSGPTVARLTKTLRDRGLHTVCEEARCPNMGECWDGGTATFMVLGDTCTRGCRFCAVKTHSQGVPVDAEEPEKVAEASVAMGLKYVVLTMVDRDDLPDGGAKHVADTIRAIKRLKPDMLVEALVGDWLPTDKTSREDLANRRRSIETVLEAEPDVYAHNIETVLRLTPRVRDHRCSYVGSLTTLRMAKEISPKVVTKSSVMLGLGENEREVEQTMDDLREYGVDVVTFGQYLRPSMLHLPVREHLSPARYKALGDRAMTKGFLYVASGPLVRSSYKAAEFYIAGLLRQRKALEAAAQKNGNTEHGIAENSVATQIAGENNNI